MTLGEWIAAGVAILGSGGLGAGLTAVFKPSSKADLIKAAQDAAKEVIGDLRTEVERLQRRIADLEEDNGACEARADLLERALKEAGIPIPARDLPGAFVVIEKDRATVLKPARRAK